MSTVSIESAALFTPGRASYLDENNVLQLTAGSERRRDVANETFDHDFHDIAVYAGGFPGLAQHWDPSLTPPPGRREANMMAVPLVSRLEAEGRDCQEIARIVAIQGDSSNSFGDVILSVERGFLDPNRFSTDMQYGIDLTTGALHGIRFTGMLSRVLDIDPRRIRRVRMRDVYGTPDFPRRQAESAAKAVATEIAAIAITKIVLRNVKLGDVDSLKEAEQRFIKAAERYS